jgi:CRP/FNR family transcriptional activator FtrB
MARLAHAITVEVVPAKTTLIQEGKAQRWLCVLFEGMLQQFTRGGSHETTLSIVKAPALLHPHSVYRATAPRTSVRTLRDSRIGRIPLSCARQLLRTEQEFAKAMVDHTVAELENILSEHKSARTRNGLGRLVAWIVAMQQQDGDKSRIILPYDKATLAARLGVAPATLSRDFALLEQYGVTVHGRALTVEDAELLRTLTRVDSLNVPPVP